MSLDAPPATEFFPDSQEPVPALLTGFEAVRFLRLDVDRDAAGALRSLRRLIETGVLRPCRIGRKNCYGRDELLRLIRQRTDEYGKIPS